jgi:hypothetical protein
LFPASVFSKSVYAFQEAPPTAFMSRMFKSDTLTVPDACDKVACVPNNVDCKNFWPVLDATKLPTVDVAPSLS